MNPSTIGKYRIIRMLGKGGMATVFEAHHELLSTKVAIKVLNPILSSQPQIRNRFINEAKMMASLNHPNITRVIDFDEQPQQLSIIMEYLEGEDMNEKINRSGPMMEKDIHNIFVQTLAACQYAHENGIVHRDIKPSNIFLLPNGQVKILDFGIAKLFGQGNDMTQTGAQIGTPVYMSPEQVRSDKSIDHRSDIYSLGVTLYFACTGKPPYDTVCETQFDIFNKIVYENLAVGFINNQFRAAIKKACEKNRADRFQSCSEMLDEYFKENNNGNYITAKNELSLEKNSSDFWEKNDEQSGFSNTIEKKYFSYRNNILIIAGGGVLLLTILFYMSFHKEEKYDIIKTGLDSTLNQNTDDKNNDVKQENKKNDNSSKTDKVESTSSGNTDSENNNIDIQNTNTEIYRDIMIGYYNDLTNDNYESLTSYYADIVNGFIDNKPVSKYELVESHKRYHRLFPIHYYRLINISPYKLENNTVSYYVILNAFVSKQNDYSKKPSIVKDVFTFDENKKIINVKVIK